MIKKGVKTVKQAFDDLWNSDIPKYKKIQEHAKLSKRVIRPLKIRNPDPKSTTDINPMKAAFKKVSGFSWKKANKKQRQNFIKTWNKA